MDKLCQNCRAPLAADAPRGLCPACLMKVAMATGTVAGQEKPGFTPPSTQELGLKFPQLEIIELIGRGGMGAVYKARQKELDRIVALKILPPGIGDDAAFAERFAREAKALARLNHPGIVTIHDFGRADGLYFFVMEFVDGVNLRQLLASARVSPREALAIVPQICDALQFAHDQGIVHRDIKPENILLDRRGRVKVADFGLAKLVESNAPLSLSLSPSDGERGTAGLGARKAPALTDAGKVMGTPAYMAPEQVAHPADVDHRADIYALGVVFYQMLTGELPGKRIEPPSKKVLIDVRLDEVVLRALEKKPELRYQQASALKTEVETILQAAASDALKEEAAQERRATPSDARTPSRARGWAKPTYAGVAVGIAVTLASWFGLHQLLKAPEPPVDNLTQVQFQQLVDSNQIAEVTIYDDPRVPLLSEIVGRYYTTDAEGKRLPETNPRAKVPFRVKVRLYPELEIRLLKIPNFQRQDWNPGWNALLNLTIGAVYGGFVGLVAGGLTALYLALRKRQRAGNASGPAAELDLATNPTNRICPADTNVFSLPLPLLLAGILLILLGAYSVWDMAYNTHYLALKHNPLMFCLPVGIGLLRLRPSWRRYALAGVWCGYALLLFILGVVFAKANGVALLRSNSAIEFFGWQPNAIQATWLGLLSFLGYAALIAWLHAVLMRPKVKALFEHQRGRGTGWPEALVVICLALFAFVWIPHKARTSSTPAHLAAPTAEGLTFGPVIERVVYETTSGRDCFLALETGMLLQPPPQVMSLFAATNWEKLYMDEPAATDPMRAWVWTSGADLVYGAPAFKHERGIMLFDAAMVGTEDYWKMGALQVTQLLQGKVSGTPSLAGVPPLRADQLPRSYAFRTKDGTMGVLQVVGFTDNPRGVKLRYKLVRGSTADVRFAPSLAPADKLSAYAFVTSRLEELKRQQSELLLQYTEAYPFVQNVRDRIGQLARQKADLEQQYPALMHRTVDP